MNLLDNLLFVALPYVAAVVFVAGCIYRYRARGFTYSSLSSQFIEGRGIRTFVLLFHWGLLGLFVLHLLAFALPSLVLAWNGSPTRLLLHEALALAFGLSAFIGLIGLLVRRLTNPRLQAVTSSMDIVVGLLLIAQFLLGLWTALAYRWGTSWFASNLSPYLWSLVKASPRIDAVGEMPLVIKLHVAGAFVILGVIPFTRLVHLLVAPLHYTWRNYQQVVWYHDRSRVRSTGAGWTPSPPANN